MSSFAISTLNVTITDKKFLVCCPVHSCYYLLLSNCTVNMPVSYGSGVSVANRRYCGDETKNLFFLGIVVREYFFFFIQCN